MSRRTFSHFIVLRSGIPCALFKDPSVAPRGILIATKDYPPTEFTVNRSDHPRGSTTYARRRVMRAIDTTDRFFAHVVGTLIEDQRFVKVALSSPRGLWEIQAFVCPPQPKKEKPPLPLSRPPMPVHNLESPNRRPYRRTLDTPPSF